VSIHAGASLEAEGISFTYPSAETAALRNVSLSLGAGAFAYLMGRTGAGKSTLAMCLNGIIPQMQAGEYTGTVKVSGEEIGGQPVHEIAQRVGLLFQDFETQLLCSDVESEVAFGLENAQMPREEMQRRVAEMLQLTGLEELRGRDPATLSGGQKQRLALAAVLAPAPEVVILDEPTTDLDPRGKHELMQTCARLRDQGITMLMADHEAPSLFAALGHRERPLTPEAAAELLRAEGWRMDEEAYARLLEADQSTEGLGYTVVEVEDAHYKYPDGSVEALAGVSLRIREGEFVVVLGQNGSGKTTLAKHINGLLRPDEGRVTVCGRTPTIRSSRAALMRRLRSGRAIWASARRR